jgi:hypothetical protein
MNKSLFVFAAAERGAGAMTRPPSLYVPTSLYCVFVAWILHGAAVPVPPLLS